MISLLNPTLHELHLLSQVLMAFNIDWDTEIDNEYVTFIFKGVKQ